MKRSVYCLLAGVLLALCCSPSIAQVDNASLSGAVRDQSGAVVPGAEVTVRNTETGVERTVPANNVGAYLFPNLIPGPYVLLVKAKGFRDETINGVTLAITNSERVPRDNGARRGARLALHHDFA